MREERRQQWLHYEVRLERPPSGAELNPYLLGGVFGAALFFGLAAARFEREAATDIRSHLQGSATKVEVRVTTGIEAVAGVLPKVTIEASNFSTDTLPFHTEPKGSQRGQLKRLRLDLRDFTLAGLHVDSLIADIPHCRFDMPLAIEHHKFRLTRSGMGTATVRIRDRDFEPFIVKRFPEVKSITVRMEHGQVTLDGFVQIAILAAKFHVESKFAVRNGSQLVFVDPVIRLGGKPADRALSRTVVKLFDPVVDLNKDLKLEGAISVESVALEDGFLTAKGSVKLPVATSN